MPTRLGRSLLLKHKLVRMLVLLASILTLFSCSREEFAIDSFKSRVSAITYLPENVHQEMLSIVFSLRMEKEQGIDLVLKTPDGSMQWQSRATVKAIDGQYWYGTVGLSLGSALSLPDGTYELSLLNQDGRTLTHEFDVSHSKRSEGESPITYEGTKRNLKVVGSMVTIVQQDSTQKTLVSEKFDNGANIQLKEKTRRVVISLEESSDLYILIP